jgi:hypothetical protein
MTTDSVDNHFGEVGVFCWPRIRGESSSLAWAMYLYVYTATGFESCTVNDEFENIQPRQKCPAKGFRVEPSLFQH